MSWLKGFLWGLAGLAVGLFVGYFGRALVSLELKKEVSADEVFDFLATIIVALLIQNVVQARFSNKRVEKDLLIETVKEVITLTKDTRNQFIICYNTKKLLTDDSKVIKGLLRNLANSINLLETSLAECKSNLRTSRLELIKRNYFEYKGVLTGGTFPSKPYTGEVFNDEESLYRELHSNLQLIIFEINKQ